MWGPQYRDETNYLRVHMAHIRRKLEPVPSRPRFFHTESGMGYRFDPPPPESILGSTAEIAPGPAQDAR